MNLKENVKRCGRIAKAALGFIYDFHRYVSFSGWSKDLTDKAVRNYHSVKIYHSLEKSMSFSDRKSSSGWTNAYLLLETCLAAKKAGNLGFHDRAAVAVLTQFVNLPENAERFEAGPIREAIASLYPAIDEATGTVKIDRLSFQKGQLADPEGFFNSRYSLREFAETEVSLETLERATSLAMKSPSACNRQPWAVYYTSDPMIRDLALKYQSGNRGFGHKIPMLLVVAADLRAFMPGQERYQHWIDGGLFSMTLILALHSLGLATCCLNWSQTSGQDKAFRSAFKVSNEETIIMMLAVGWPRADNTVCVSARRPMTEILKPLKKA